MMQAGYEKHEGDGYASIIVVDNRTATVSA